MPTGLVANFVNVGSLPKKKNISLPRGMEYMGIYGRSPGIPKYVVADFVVAGFDFIIKGQCKSEKNCSNCVARASFILCCYLLLKRLKLDRHFYHHQELPSQTAVISKILTMGLQHSVFFRCRFAYLFCLP